MRCQGGIRTCRHCAAGHEEAIIAESDKIRHDCPFKRSGRSRQMNGEKKLQSAYLRALGLDREITRRDFLNGLLLGAGAVLLDLPAPMRLYAQTTAWAGHGGTDDYAGSNGDTEEVVRTAHGIRDGLYNSLPADAIETGEVYDLVIIGGGISGLGAAFHFTRAARPGQKCLILENHKVFGGQASRNEFIVNGQRLIGPQGSNSFVVIDEPGAGGHDFYSKLGIPREFRYQNFERPGKKLWFDRTNYGFMLWYDDQPGIGYFFGEDGWRDDLWARDLAEAPFSEKTKKDFSIWRNSEKRYYEGRDFEQWLDTMTYKEYLEKIMGVGPGIPKFADPVLASSIGLGSDVISAFGAYQVSMPGFQGFPAGFARRARSAGSDWHSFPGGNDGIARYFIKSIIPGAVRGGLTFEDILNRRIGFDALDRVENSVRMRLGALAVSVGHEAGPESSEYVRVAYAKEKKIYLLKARGVVMANGSWVSRKIVKDLSEEYREAFGQFHRSPMLVANVALTNWRFLYRLGLTACRWFEGFGFSCNIRRPMLVGDYRPPLDPDRPAVMTFYIPFYYPGLPIHEQGVRGRMELLSTGFAEYELKIREQMARLFRKGGFDPKKDIAGIILNRWGHAFVNPQPGFYYGKAGRPAPRHIIRRRFGRIAFGHAELNGHQHWVGAAEEGRRAAKQVMSTL